MAMSLLLTSRRRIAQFLSLALLNSNFWSIGGWEKVCLPILNCYACPISWLGCPIGTLSHSVFFREVPFLLIAVLAGAGILAGRFFCGWVCPTGLAQDLLYKIPFLKFGMPRLLTWTKYCVLAVLVILLPRFMKGEHFEDTFSFCRICPTATVEVVLPDMIKAGDFSMDPGRILRWSVLGVVVILALGNHRSFCKMICPVGALMAITNKFSLFSLRIDGEKCVHCMKCDKACPMDVPAEEYSTKKIGISRNAECIECLTCEQVCPTTAISNNSRLLHK